MQSVISKLVWAVFEVVGERAGARTQDPVIKSHVLYRLSYALPWLAGWSREEIAIATGICQSMSCRRVDVTLPGKPADAACWTMLSVRAV